MDKKTLSKKMHPWRNCLAALFTCMLIGACIALLSRSRNAISINAIRSSEIFRRYNSMPAPEKYPLPHNSDFYEDFNRTYGALYSEPEQTHTEQRFSLGDGDIVGIHSGGRSRSPEGLAEKGSDERRWLDAKVKLKENSRIRLYGAGGVGMQFGDSNPSGHPSFSTDSLSVGGGFGFSYRINEKAELIFDYRHSKPLDPDSSYRQADSAGFTLRFSF